MGVLDDVVTFLTGVVDDLRDSFDRWLLSNIRILNFEAQGRVATADDPKEQFREEVTAGNTREETDDASELVERALAGVFDTFEDDVLENIETGEALTPENVEGKINEAEGAALEDALGIIGSTLAIELAGATQLETHEEAITQIATFLTLEEVLGRRLGMAYEKGVDPALEAEVAKNTRSEFVSLQDAHEFLLRAKTADEGYITGDETLPGARDVIASNEPVNPANPLEEWGIRDDNLQILERVGLQAPEIEELVESPVQFGVVPGEEVTEEVLQISGLPEKAKDLFRETIEAAPDAADLWEQRTRTGELVGELDSLVLDDELTPEQAELLLPDTVDASRPAIVDRWELMADIPAGRPSQSEFEDAFAWGYTDPQTFRERLTGSEFPAEKYPGVVNSIVLGEADGQLRTAVGLGLLDEATYTSLLTEAGIDEGTIDKLLRGTDLDKIAMSRLTEGTRSEGGGLTTIPQIGSERAFALRQAGIETVAALAEADPQTVADALATSLEFAGRLIAAAEVRLQ